MVEELSEFSAGEFQGFTELFLADQTLQVLVAILGGGLLFIAIFYHHFGKWLGRMERELHEPTQNEGCPFCTVRSGSDWFGYYL